MRKFYTFTILIVVLMWSTSNPAVISVNKETGEMKFIHVGTSNICVHYGSIEQCITLDFK